MIKQRLPERESDGFYPAYAWPGGYQIIYYIRDGCTVCPACASREVDFSQEPTDYDIFYEGENIYCDDCNAVIESAYGDPDAEEDDDEKGEDDGE